MIIDLYNRIIERAYNEAETTYTLDECIEIISYFLNKYFEVMGHRHLPISHKHLVNIINKIDTLSSNDPFEDDMDFTGCSDYYPELIDQYFDTDLDCDYTIYHFFSGRVRLNRMYEACY